MLDAYQALLALAERRISTTWSPAPYAPSSATPPCAPAGRRGSRTCVSTSSRTSTLRRCASCAFSRH